MNNSDKVYQVLLKQSMETIARQIQSLEQKNRGLRALSDKTTVEIEGLKLQYNEIVNTLKNYQERINVSDRKEAKLDKLDEKSERITKEQQEHHDQINTLNQAQNKMKTARGKRKVAKEIRKQQEIIRKLQKKNARIDKRQKAIMLPAFYRDQKRSQLISKQEAKVKQVAANMQDNQELQAMLDLNKTSGRIKSVVHDIKGAYYQKRLNHSQEVLDTMKNSNLNITIRGANAITISKKAVNGLRNAVDRGKDAILNLLDENINTTTKQPTMR